MTRSVTNSVLLETVKELADLRTRLAAAEAEREMMLRVLVRNTNDDQKPEDHLRKPWWSPLAIGWHETREQAESAVLARLKGDEP